MTMSKALLILLAAFGIWFYPLSDSLAKNQSCDFFDSIDIRQVTEILAHNTAGNRGVGEAGFEVAGTFLARELRNAGFLPLAGLSDSYFQQFSFKGFGKEVSSRNVLAYVGGVGEPNEYIIIGAHYDNLGIFLGSMHPGADDNASGVAGVLAVAHALGKAVEAGAVLKKSVIIAFWGAEEWGVRGSRHFVQSNVIPIEQIAAVINLDMIGRNDPIAMFALGTDENGEFKKQSPKLYSILEEENSKLPRSFRLITKAPDKVFSKSDHFPFFEARKESQIPVLFLTSGGHGDYHQPTDTTDKLNIDKISRAACLSYRVLFRLATS